MITRRPATTPEVAADYSCTAGAAPAWHPAEQRLYWVDSAGGRLFRCTPAARTHEQVYQAGAGVGGLTIQVDGTVLLLMSSGTVKVWREDSVVTIREPDDGGAGAAVACAAADPAGRVILGLALAGERGGRICRMETDGRIVQLAEGAHPPAGFAFAPDGRGLYCADWPRGTVTLFAFDAGSGAIGEPRPFAVFPGSLGTPAGLAVDAKGFVWAGARGGSCALRFSAEGREDQRLYFTATLVTGLALAGEDGRDLWVTTAGGDDKAANGAGAGALYRFRAGVRGPAAQLSRIVVARE
jgi:D-xylono/L-arabinono-1,4-lactonase